MQAKSEIGVKMYPQICSLIFDSANFQEIYREFKSIKPSFLCVRGTPTAFLYLYEHINFIEINKGV